MRYPELNLLPWCLSLHVYQRRMMKGYDLAITQILNGSKQLQYLDMHQKIGKRKECRTCFIFEKHKVCFMIFAHICVCVFVCG